MQKAKLNKIKRVTRQLKFPLALLLLTTLALPIGNSASDNGYNRESPLGFINFFDNKIFFRPDIQLDDKFENIVKNASKGIEPLRIMHLGDSHVQADMFTGEIRRLFALWLTDANPARGFIFPYELAGTNNPADFEVKSDVKWQRVRIVDTPEPAQLGLSGIALTTNERSGNISVRIKKINGFSNRFNLVKLHYACNTDNVKISAKTNGEVLTKTNGFWEYKLMEDTDSIKIHFSCDANFKLFGLELLNTNSKVIYNSAGVNGAEVRTYLLSENIQQQLARINPHLVIISLGTNDAYNPSFNQNVFYINLRDFVERIQGFDPEVLVILTTPGDHLIKKEAENFALEKIQQEIYRVANEKNCGVWDFYHVMGGTGSIRLWSQQGLSAPDMLHLSKNGYRLQGSLLFGALVDLSGYSMEALTTQNLGK